MFNWVEVPKSVNSTPSYSEEEKLRLECESLISNAHSDLVKAIGKKFTKTINGEVYHIEVRGEDIDLFLRVNNRKVFELIMADHSKFSIGDVQLIKDILT